MSSQDLLGIFGSSAAAKNEDEVDALHNVSVENNDMLPNCNTSSAVVSLQQDSPESILFDMTNEAIVNNPESNSANMNDLLGIFNNSEPIQTKANNPGVDLIGGFTQSNSNDNDVADGASSKADLVFSSDGPSDINLVEIADSVVTELSATVKSSNQTSSNLTSDLGDTIFAIGLSEDTKPLKENDLLSVTELTLNQNCTGDMESNRMHEMENPVSETHEIKNEDMNDKVDTLDNTELIDAHLEPINSHITESGLHEDIDDVGKCKDVSHTSNVDAHDKSDNILKIENRDVLNLELTPEISPAQLPILALVPPQTGDLLLLDTVENSDLATVKDSWQELEIANDSAPDSYSEMASSSILTMNENPPISSDLLNLSTHNSQKQDNNSSAMQQMEFNIMGDQSTGSINSPSSALAYFERKDNMTDVSDDILLFQDDTSLNTFKKSDTSLHDTLESFNDMSTSTVEHSVVELPVEEAVSKHTPCEGENVIRLPDTTAKNNWLKKMSGISCDVEVLDVVEELLQKVYLGAAADLGISRNRDVIVEEVDFSETQKDELSFDAIDQDTLNLVSTSQPALAEIESLKADGTVQQTMLEQPNVIFNLDKYNDRIDDNVTSILIPNAKYDSSSTSDWELNSCDDTHTSDSKQSTKIPSPVCQNEYDTDKDKALLDSNFDDSSAKEEQTEVDLESVNYSTTAGEKVVEVDQMRSMIGDITEICTKDSLQVDSNLSIPSNASAEIAVTKKTIQQHSSDDKNYIHEVIVLNEVTQSMGTELLSNHDIANDNLDDGFEHFTEAELTAAHEMDDVPNGSIPPSPLVTESVNIPIDSLLEVNSATDDVWHLSFEHSDSSSYSTHNDYENHTTLSKYQKSEATGKETIDGSGAENVATNMFEEPTATQNVEDSLIAIGALNTASVLTSTSEVHPRSSKSISCENKMSKVSAPPVVEDNGLKTSFAEVKSERLESMSLTATVLSQDEEETLPIIPKRRSKKNTSFIDPLENIQQTTESLAQDQTVHAKDELPALSNQTDVLSIEVCEEEGDVSNLMQGPVAARLVERLVDDIMYNAITIVRDEALSETDEITGSSTCQDEISIDEESDSVSSKIEDMAEVPTVVSQTLKVCAESNSDEINASVNNHLSDMKLDDEEESPPEAPVRKKKKHQSHEPPDIEGSIAKEQSESAHNGLTLASSKTSDLLPAKIIISSNLGESITGDSNTLSENGDNNGATDTVSELRNDAVHDVSPTNLLTQQSFPEDTCSKQEIDNQTWGDEKSQLLFNISDDKDHSKESDSIAVNEVNHASYELPTAEDRCETEVFGKNQKVLISDNDEKEEKSDIKNLDSIKEHSNKSVNNFAEDLSSLTNRISPTLSDHIVETCITSTPLLNIDDDQLTAARDESSTASINNAENNIEGVETMNCITIYHSQTDGAAVETDIVGVSDVNPNESNEGELRNESYELQKKLQHGNAYNAVMEPSSHAFEADEINQTDEIEKVQDSPSSVNYRQSEVYDPKMQLQDAYSVTVGGLMEDHNVVEQQGSITVQNQQALPPPLPEADYEDMDFDELPHSKSDIAMGGEYFDEGYYTLDASYKGTNPVGSGVSVTSSFMKKSVSLPASYYSNFSSPIPSTVFIDKDMLSDNDDSDAESVKSADSNDENVAGSDDMLSSAAITDFVMDQYKNLSTDSSLSDFDPQSSYQAYDNDWEDIVTEPFRRFSGLPVILEESEVDETDEDSDDTVSSDPDPILHESDVEIPSITINNRAYDAGNVNEHITQSKETSDNSILKKESEAEPFQATNAVISVDPVRSIGEEIVSSDPQCADTNFLEHSEIANDCNIISYGNVADSGAISEQNLVAVQSEHSQSIKDQTPCSPVMVEKNFDCLVTSDECYNEPLPTLHGVSHPAPQLQIKVVEKSDPGITHEESQLIDKEGSGVNVDMANLHSTEESPGEEVLPLCDDSSETRTQQIVHTDLSTLNSNNLDQSLNGDQEAERKYEANETMVGLITSVVPSGPTAMNEDEPDFDESLCETDIDTSQCLQFTAENRIETSSDIGILSSESLQVPSIQTAITDSSKLSSMSRDKQNQRVEDDSLEIVDIEQSQVSKEIDHETAAIEAIEHQSISTDPFIPSPVIGDDREVQEKINKTGVAIENPQISDQYHNDTSLHYYTPEVLSSHIMSHDSNSLETSEGNEILQQQSLDLDTTMQYPQVTEEFNKNSITSVPNNTEFSVVSENDVIHEEEGFKITAISDSSCEGLSSLQIPPEQTEYGPAPKQKGHETVDNADHPRDSDQIYDETPGYTQPALQQTTPTGVFILAAHGKEDLGARGTDFESDVNITDPWMSAEYHGVALSSLHNENHQGLPEHNTLGECSESTMITADDQKVIEGGSLERDKIMEPEASELHDGAAVFFLDNPEQMVPQPVRSLASAVHAAITVNNEKEHEDTHISAEQPQSMNEILDETSTSLNDGIREEPLLKGARLLQQSDQNNDAITGQHSPSFRYYDTSEEKSMDYTHESTGEISSHTNAINDVDKSISKSTCDTLTDTFSASFIETSSTENANMSKEIFSQENSLSQGIENTENLMSHNTFISDSKVFSKETIPVLHITDSAEPTEMKASESIDAKVSPETEKANDILIVVDNEVNDDKPPPPPSRKKKKAKQMEATYLDQSVPEQIEQILSPKNNLTQDLGDLPENIDNSAYTSALKVGNINNETHYHEQEQLEQPSSIIYDNTKAKQVAEADMKSTELTDNGTAFVNCSQPTTLIMVDEILCDSSQHGDDDDRQNCELENKPVLIEGHDHQGVASITSVLCTDSDDMETNESKSKSEGYDIDSQQTSDLLYSLSRVEEDDNDLLIAGVHQTVSSTPEDGVIALDSVSKEAVSTDAQEMMNKVLFLPDSTSNTVTLNSTDEYSSSENEYEISNEDIENAVEMPGSLQSYHLFADKLIGSILNDLVVVESSISDENEHEKEMAVCVDLVGNLAIEKYDTGTHENSHSSEEEITTNYDETQDGKVDEVNELLEITEIQKAYRTIPADILEILNDEDETLHPEKDAKRQRFDTTGSIRYLTDSEEEDAEVKGKANRLISLDDDIFVEDSAESINSASQDSEEGNRLVAKRKSLVPPSSLVLSVALDEIDLRDKSDVQETPVSQRLSLSSSLTSSQTSLSSSGGEVAGNKRSMLPRLPSLRMKKPANPVVPEVIKTKYHYVDPAEIIPIVPMPDLKRVVKWENVTIRNIEYQIDEAVVQPYKKVISHGGFYDRKSTIIEIFLPYLPASNLQHYEWIMDNLFLYVLATVELLAQGKFSIVMFVGPKSHIPANALLRRWHQHVEYRLKKNVEAFYIVNPTFYFKTMARLFVSRKVNKKMKYVKSLAELGTFIPTDFLFVPPEIAK